MDEKERAFILELRELTMKHGIAIWGCGCCGSPHLVKADVTDDRSGYAFGAEDDRELMWVSPIDKAAWFGYSKEIIGK